MIAKHHCTGLVVYACKICTALHRLTASRMQMALRWPQAGQKISRGSPLCVRLVAILLAANRQLIKICNKNVMHSYNMILICKRNKNLLAAGCGCMRGRQLSASPLGEQFQEEEKTNCEKRKLQESEVFSRTSHKVCVILAIQSFASTSAAGNFVSWRRLYTMLCCF